MTKFYITTSIAYANAPPHIGFALEIVQADVIARYHRFLNEEVFFLTGTDEHGAKAVKAAEAAGQEPKDFVDHIAGRFLALREPLNLSNSDFIRTTDKKRHWPTAQKVWRHLQRNGDLYKRLYQGFYCVGCESFITRKDLIDGKCAIHQKEPESIEEENYFFRLSKYDKGIERAIDTDELKIIPRGRKNEMLSFIRQGLEDVSFSRPRKNLPWGIPVPEDSAATMYVWGDALTNYISALGYDQDSPQFKKFWPADVHCIGKDILRFHAIIWPGMLFALGLPLPKTIFVHGYLAVDGKKMSKSLGNVIDPFTLVEKYGTDPVRYYLLRELPPTEDGDFTYQKFEQRYNGDLAAGLGNLVSRVLTMAEKITIQPNNNHPVLHQKIDALWDHYKKALEAFRFNEALAVIWELIAFADRYIEQEKPWEESSDKKGQVVYHLLSVLAHVASLLQPLLPETSASIFQQLGVKPTDTEWKFNIKKEKPLFPKIESN